MTRPKINNTDLPPRLRFANGAYFYADARGGRKAWIHLGYDREAALRMWETIESAGDEFNFDADPEKWAPGLYVRSKQQAAVRGIPFDLTTEELIALAKFGRNCCAVTGIPFEFTTKIGSSRPWAPSLDRIDSRLGYSFQNCRLVCVAANVALNQWGTEVFERMARGYLERVGAIPRRPEAEAISKARRIGTPNLTKKRVQQQQVQRSKYRNDILKGGLSDLYWANRLKVSERIIRDFRESSGHKAQPTTMPTTSDDDV